jgi:IMP and pyridine-specific 5'-nucleotidase
MSSPLPSIGASVTSSRRRNYLLTPHRRDPLIEWIKGLLYHSFVLDSMSSTAEATWAHCEQLIDEHRAAAGAHTTLSEAAPGIAAFFTPLPLRDAWLMYDAKYRVSCRRFVQPSFNEIRHILNLAQVLAMRKTKLRLVSFDGDCTLCA